MDLEAGPPTCFDQLMSTTLIEVRPAKAADAAAVASTHDEAWRSAYQGIIPGAELEKLINRRGPQWWDSAIRKGSRVSVLVFGDKVAGYANYGRNRARSLHFDGEIYELYLRPEFQRQSRDFHAVVQQAGKPAELIVAEGYNHFELVETLSNPYGILGRAVLRQMGLG